MADLVNGYGLSEEAVRDLNELFRKVRAKSRVHTGRPDEFGRPGPRPGFHEPVKLTSLTTTGGLYPGVRSVLDLSTMVYADETVAVWVRSVNGRALNDTTARLWARLEGMTDPGADPRALYLVDDPGGTGGSFSGTLDFGTSGSAAASPPGVLDLPTLTVAGPPTWVPGAGVYPLEWDSATGILYAWTGAAWVNVDSGTSFPQAQYVTLATDATLTSERVLTAGAGVTITDAGAGSTVTVATDSSVPRWVKVTKVFSDLSTGSTANDIEALSLPAGGVVHATKVKHSAAFTGGTLSQYLVTVGISGVLSKYSGSPGLNVFTAPAATGGIQWHNKDQATIESHTATTSIRLAANSTGANLSAATQGTVDVWILYSVMT